MNYGMVITAVAVVAVASVAGVIFIDPTTPDEEVTVEMVMGSDTQTVKVDKGAYVDSLPEVTAPPGMSFMGWYSSLDSMSAYGADTPINANCVLYALFANTAPGFDTSREHHVVQFKYNIRDVQPTYIAVNHNESVSFPDVTETIGAYTFAGWYTDTSFRPSSIYIDDVPVRSDMTLYGYYSSVTYNVSFDSSGGRIISGYEARLDVMEGQTLDGAWGGSFPRIMEKDNFIFSHWETEDGNVWDTSRNVVTENVVLYAKWARILDISNSNATVTTNDHLETIYGNDIYVHIARIDGLVYTVLSDVCIGHNGPLTLTRQWSTTSEETIGSTTTLIESHTTGSSDSHEVGFNVNFQFGPEFLKINIGGSYKFTHEDFSQTTNSTEHARSVSNSLSETYGTGESFGFEYASSTYYYAILLMSTADIFEKITVNRDGTYTTEVVTIFGSPAISARSSTTQNFSNLTQNYSLLSDTKVREYIEKNKGSLEIAPFCDVKYHVGDSVTTVSVYESSTNHMAAAGGLVSGRVVVGWSTVNPDSPNFIRNDIKNTQNASLQKGTLDVYVISVPNVCSDFTLIVTGDDLKNIKNNIYGRYILIKDISLSGDWTPISKFCGILDGDGHAISSLRIRTSNSHGGMFKEMDGGKVVNLTVDANIDYSKGNMDDRYDFGVISGHVYNGSRIKNCMVTGVINKGDRTGWSSIGGICGSLHSSIIESCISKVAIDVNSVQSYTGGIAGWVDNSTISSCLHQSEITACAKGECDVGGIAGRLVSGSFIEKCASAGKLNSNNRDTPLLWIGYKDTGGIAGRNYDSTIRNCFIEKDKLYEGDGWQNDRYSDGGNNKNEPGNIVAWVWNTFKNNDGFKSWSLDTSKDGLPELLKGNSMPRYT